MDQSKVKEWVGANLERLMAQCGIPHWRVVVWYDALDEATAECSPRLKYESARITIDPARIDDIEELERVLRHELFHIVHSPFHILWDAVAQTFTQEQCDIFNQLWSYAQEMTVKNLERMHSGYMEVFSKQGVESCSPTP